MSDQVRQRSSGFMLIGQVSMANLDMGRFGSNAKVIFSIWTSMREIYVHRRRFLTGISCDSHQVCSTYPSHSQPRHALEEGL